MFTIINATNYNPDDICAICQEAFGTMKKVVSHDKEKLHKVHEECLEQWLARSQTCPFCRANAAIHHSLSWKERLVTEIKNLSTLELNIATIVALAYGTMTLSFTKPIFGLAAVSAGFGYGTGETAAIVLSTGIVFLTKRHLR